MATNWLVVLKAYVDTLETIVGTEGGVALANKLTVARAVLLDQITALRMAELDPANLPADIDLIKGYTDTLEAAIGAIEGATTLHNKLTAARATLLDQITALRMAELDPANIPADVDTLKAAIGAIEGATALHNKLTAARALLLDQITALRLAELDPANLPADVDLIKGYTDSLEGAIGAIEGATTLHNKLTAARAALLDQITALRMAELDAANMPADIDLIRGYTDTLEAAVGATEGATTLHNKLTAARAALLDQITALRMAELDAANLPADIDTIKGYTDSLEGAIGAIEGATTLHNKLTAARAALLDQITAARLAELDAANLPADVDGLKTSRNRQLFSLDFWSAPQEEVAIPAIAATLTLPNVVVADLPAGATIVRAIALVKFRMIENINVAANTLNGATVAATSQVIQVQDAAAGGWVDAINFVNLQFGIAASTREGGDVLIGSIDIANRVDANDTYSVRYLLAKAALLGINLNDMQAGLRIWYSV